MLRQRHTSANLRRLLAVATLLLLPIAAGAQRPNVNNLPGTEPEEPDTTQSQEPQGIIFESDGEADSLMPEYVFGFAPTRRDVKIRRLTHPTLDPTGVSLHNAANLLDGHYWLDRGALGLTQLSAYPYVEETRSLLDRHEGPGPLTLRLQPDANPVYRQTMHRERMFQTLRPYTMLQYGSSLNKDYQIRVVHTQNIQPRWNFAFLYDLVSRDGLYTNSDVTNHVVDATTNYYSEDARYQLQAAVRLNRLRQQENGGVQNDTTCWNSSRREGVPVNMYSAQNQWRDLEISLHQSYNTVRQFLAVRPVKRQLVDTVYTTDTTQHDSTARTLHVTVRDTIVGYDTLHAHQPHVYNTGVFALDLNFARHRRIFYDNQADSWFYNYGMPDSTVYFDSTAHYQFGGELYWTNDAYMQHRWRNPMVIAFGVRPELNRIQYADQRFSDASVQEFTVSPFARATFELKHFVLTASAEEVTGSARNGDYRLAANISVNAGKRSRFDIGAVSEAQTPDLMYRHNEGCYTWDLTNLDKVKRQQVAAGYTVSRTTADSTGHSSPLVELQTRTSATLLTDNIWLNSNMMPTQGDGSGLLLQATVLTHLRFGWFNIRLQEMVQHSSDDAVMRVPLLASKNSFYADMYLFRRALRMQTGFDLRYHTRYKADGWNPVLGAFYRQDDVEVGNYLVADFWVSLQVKRASIYLKTSHFNAPIADLTGQTPNYFSLPHYPMEDFGLYWGVVWKFFN